MKQEEYTVLLDIDPDRLDKMDLLESRLSLSKEGLLDSKLLAAHRRLFDQCLRKA